MGRAPEGVLFQSRLQSPVSLGAGIASWEMSLFCLEDDRVFCAVDEKFQMICPALQFFPYDHLS
jgi:hypothetical protein